MTPSDLYIGIDPGPTHSGVVVYVVEADGSGKVVAAFDKLTLEEVRTTLHELHTDEAVVAIEHTHPGPPSWSVIHTTVVLGRLLEHAELLGMQTVPVHRKDVKAYLGKSDSEIRRNVIEQHGLDPDDFHHTRPTALQGVTGHAWQALAAVLTLHDERTTT
jgi:hypothetical protein